MNLSDSPYQMAKRGIAFQSPLWPHLEQIRSWRRARKTWRWITEELRTKHGITLTLQAVHSFFASASKRQAPPLGFDSLPGQPVPPTPVGHECAPQPSTEPESKDFKERFAEHTRRELKAEAEKAKKEKRLQAYEDDDK